MYFTKISFGFFWAVSIAAFGQQDNFDDGNDLGWARADPLSELGVGEVTSFQLDDGKYRIRGGESPSPNEAGPSRGGAFRAEVVYESDFFVSVDLVGFDASLRQAIGLLALVQPNPSLGTTSGYSLNYQPEEKDLIINLVQNEEPIRLGVTTLSEDPGVEPLRLIFEGKNGVLKGRIFRCTDLTEPLATIEVSDLTYTSGVMGLFVFSDTDDASGGTDATFDNYVANAHTMPLLDVRVEGDQVQVLWPDWAVDFYLEESTSLKEQEWTAVDWSGIARKERRFVWEGGNSNLTSRFFRLGRN